MISRVLLSLAAVVATVGLLIYGMGTSYNPTRDSYERLGLIMLVVGAIGVVVGIFLYRSTEAGEEAAARAKYGPERH